MDERDSFLVLCSGAIYQWQSWRSARRTGYDDFRSRDFLCIKLGAEFWARRINFVCSVGRQRVCPVDGLGSRKSSHFELVGTLRTRQGIRVLCFCGGHVIGTGIYNFVNYPRRAATRVALDIPVAGFTDARWWGDLLFRCTKPA